MSSAELPKHIYLGGTEMEYPAMLIDFVRSATDGTLKHQNERAFNDSEVGNALSYVPDFLKDPANPDAFSGIIQGGMASNGARIYKDIGQKIEYATPEATSYRDTVHAGIAGEQIIVAALKKFARTVTDRKLMIRGCTGDSDGITWGRHGSYLMPRTLYPNTDVIQTDDQLKKRLLCKVAIAHFATKQLFTGGGMLLMDQEGVMRFERSQKIPSLNHAIHSGTTNDKKPLFNTRDEPHADREKYYRWHTTSSDYNLSPWAAWMDIGTTDLLGYLVLVQTVTGTGKMHEIALRDGCELDIAKAISKDEDHVFELKNSKKVKAVDVQDMICSELETTYGAYSHLFTAEDKEIMDEYRFAVDAQRNNPDRLTLCVDWRKRLELINSYQDRHPNATPETLHKVEQFWDNLDNGKGVQLRDFTRMPGYDISEINRLKYSPPGGTRAVQRSQHIKSITAKTLVGQSGDWTEVRLRNLITKQDIKHTFKDPFDTDSTLVGNTLQVAS